MAEDSLKPLFVERMKLILNDENDFKNYLKSLEKPPAKSIRCNTLKISPSELKKRLLEKGWKIRQPFKKHPEIMIIESELQPGELGRSMEHLLGYYYIQEIASMLPVISLGIKSGDVVLDLCSAPGSKTTQIAANMKNKGTIIANDVSVSRIKILASNLERCGVANAIITRKDGVALCKNIKKQFPELLFDKILVDAPCSGEGTLRSSQKTKFMWNIKTVKSLSKLQKMMFAAAFELLKPEGIIVYSTCTHAPEENEEVVDFALRNFEGKIKIEKPNLPSEMKFKEGLKEWNGKKYVEDVKYCCRIYPHDNDTDGFFISRFRRLK